MKKISLVMILFGVVCLISNANATKWKNGFIENIGGCEVQHQYCDRQFLSFDGCEYGDTRAVFDTGDPDCLEMLTNAHIL